jgi:hypothetical protein
VRIVTRAGRELRAAAELWLVPFVIAALPYRAGIAVARVAARVLPIYSAAANSAVRAFAHVVPGVDARQWCARFRFHVLLDHADLYWVLLRPRGFLDRFLRGAPPLPAAGTPLMVFAFHYGQGMALMRWLAAAGHPPRFVSIRLAREDADSSIAYAYARLRNRTVERFAGQPLILTGGARREIARTLGERGTVLALVDVPLADASLHAANARLLDTPVVLPVGLLESMIPQTRAWVASARVDDAGLREIEAAEVDAGALTIGELAEQLSVRLVEAPEAWHFWHLWPRFLAQRPGIAPGQGTPAQ